jgi:hypothetical protein
MGLTERFRENLNSKNIFEPKAQIEQKPSVAMTNPIKTLNKFEDLETGIIEKIRRTPYWDEFSTIRKKNMIRAYFGTKVRSSMCSQNEQEEFIQNVLTLSNHR